MIREIFSIYDMKTAVYQQPMYAINEEDAKRNITAFLMQDKESLLSRFPDNYKLYRLGIFEDHTGEINTENFEEICNLQELV